MGIRASSYCQLYFDCCWVPDNRVIGKVGEGFRIAMKSNLIILDQELQHKLWESHRGAFEDAVSILKTGYNLGSVFLSFKQYNIYWQTWLFKLRLRGAIVSNLPYD